MVKKNRKIYLTLNPSGYRKVLVPDLKERTFRQAKPTLEALGFKIGKLTYIDNIAKDKYKCIRRVPMDLRDVYNLHKRQQPGNCKKDYKRKCRKCVIK